jgi:hypothetical protein
MTNPRRAAAGRINAAKRRPWGEHDRLRLARQCTERQPWLWATGPRTQAGKRRSAANGSLHLPDPNSLRQLRAGLTLSRQILKRAIHQRQAFSDRGAAVPRGEEAS